MIRWTPSVARIFAGHALLANSNLPLLPPRPNPGPLTWEPEGPPGWSGLLGPLTIAVAVAVATALGLALVLWNRRRRGRTQPLAVPSAEQLASLPPRERVLVLARLLRETLTERWGASWRARTTEEIAADPELARTLGEERVSRLVHWLAEADRIRFGDTEASSENGGPAPEEFEALRSEWLEVSPAPRTLRAGRLAPLKEVSSEASPLNLTEKPTRLDRPS